MTLWLSSKKKRKKKRGTNSVLSGGKRKGKDYEARGSLWHSKNRKRFHGAGALRIREWMRKKEEARKSGRDQMQYLAGHIKNLDFCPQTKIMGFLGLISGRKQRSPRVLEVLIENIE